MASSSVYRTIIASNKLLILHLVELGIIPVLVKQILVTPDFLDFAMVQHDDFIGFLDGGQPVSNNDGCTSLIIFRMACWIISSVSVSTDEVASSSTRIFGSYTMARINEISWRCPTLSVAPRSITL